ncbi:hypothetical protein AMBR_MGDJBKAP_02174 [Leuconostoc pseudomesenteroides]|nr:hypothetical protein AMBR_MGDJBKAP_02174 [Leuconostoc pseudomesenteroides]
MITPNTMQQQANSISDIYVKLEQDMVDCKIKPNTLHKKAAETLMVIV